jgi:hypothetical protein
MKMPEVRCSVANCEYWATGNKCEAGSIMIDIDQHANADFTAEFADDAGFTEHKDRAGSIQNTCCHTFEPKKK